MLQKLHPEAKKFEWFDFLKRGGSGNNPPATDGPHLDYYQDWAQGQVYRDMEAQTSDADIPDLVIGVWRPCMMKNPVYDYPFVYCSADTFKESAMVRFEQEFSHKTPRGVEDVKNLAAHLHFEEGQKWFYHPEQTCKEVLLFRHYTKAEFKANVHCAIKQELPKGNETRRSMENRVMIWF